MFFSNLTQIEKIIEIISQYTKGHITNGTENIGSISPIIYKDFLENITNAENKNKYLIEILKKYVYNDRQLLHLVSPYINFEYAYSVLEMIDDIKEIDGFKNISFKEVMSITMKINRNLIDEDLHTKYILYRKANTVYSKKEMNDMRKDIFRDVLNPSNELAKPTALNSLIFDLEVLEFMKYMTDEDLDSYTVVSMKLDNFLKPLIEDKKISEKLKIKKLTFLVFVGFEDKKIIENFINELPSIYGKIVKYINNSVFDYDDYKEIIYKNIDYLNLDNSMEEKAVNSICGKVSQKI